MSNPSEDERPGTFIHRFSKGDTTCLTLLLLHGTGGNENSLMDLGAELLPGASLLSPRGNVLENRLPRFFRRISEGVFDEMDLRQRTMELSEFIKDATAYYSLDPQAIVAVGYSNGANIAASLLLTQPDQLAGAVLLRAMQPFEPDTVPPLSGKQILLLSGDRDPLVPHHRAGRLAELLRDAGAKVRHEYVHAGHALTEPEIQTVQEFLTEIK